MKLTCYIFPIIIFAVTQVSAQNRTISGKVSASTGQAVSSASVSVLKASFSTVTDTSGIFLTKQI